MFTIIRISALTDNYIWLLNNGTSAVVVDPGSASEVLDTLKRENLTLGAILITHHHQDHQGGISELLEHYPADVYGPAIESITALSQPLRGGETIHLKAINAQFQVIAVPGHTAGHLAFYGHNSLFCGDTLFGAGCGRVFEGTYDQMHDSLMRLSLLPEQTDIYCAHEYTEANLRFARLVEPGNSRLQARVNETALARSKAFSTLPSTLEIEKASNPFLRCNQPEVIRSAQSQDQNALEPASVFRVLREWKNRFQ